MKRIKALLSNNFIQDTVLSIGSKLIFFMVWKFLIDPWLNVRLGDFLFGKYVVWMGFISILAYGCGEALNHIRVLNQESDKERAAEYRLIIIAEAVFSVILLGTYAIWVEKLDFMEAILLGFCAVLMMFRLYAECMFRIEINYRKILISSVIMSIGYLIGYFVFLQTGRWHYIYIIGESIAVLYFAVVGKAFYAYHAITGKFWQLVRSAVTLTSSYLIGYALIYLDRILVLFLLDEQNVSVYYVATNYGKCVALVIPPITSVLLSNISKGTIALHRKMVTRIVLGSLSAIVLFSLVGMPVSRAMTWILYRSSYEACLPIMDIANLAQIVYYSCSIVNMLAIRLCDMKLQVIVETVYAIAFIALAFLGARTFGLFGLSIGTLIANGLRFIMLTVPVYKSVEDKTYS